MATGGLCPAVGLLQPGMTMMNDDNINILINYDIACQPRSWKSFHNNIREHKEIICNLNLQFTIILEPFPK